MIDSYKDEIAKYEKLLSAKRKEYREINSNIEINNILLSVLEDEIKKAEKKIKADNDRQ